MSESAAAIWTPSQARIRESNLAAFQRFCTERDAPDFGAPGHDAYERFWKWSVDERQRFWPQLWEFCGVVGEHGATADPASVLVNDAMGPPESTGMRWFPNARLNYAENLLRHGDDHVALASWNENGSGLRLTYEELRRDVIALALALRGTGVGVGDRVAGFLPNIPETIIAMLATSAVGATWSSCSPDFGVQGVIDRFGQIEPKVLFCAERYQYAGKTIDLTDRIEEIVSRLPTVEQVVIAPYLTEERERIAGSVGTVWDEFIGSHLYRLAQDADSSAADPLFPRLPFDHPLYIMYSSGTTGLPKCLVHGAGGTLLQHQKEHVLHSDLKPQDKIFYFTTCGWMMWNWLASALAVGSTVVLYDGAPLSPSSTILWDMGEREKITHFGTSAKYLALLEKSGAEPARTHDLSALKAILSTGSPLAAHSFDFVYNKIKPDVHLASVSGGTDIIACFAIGNPTAPVYRGELQSRALGMATDVFDDSGKPLRGTAGELVCGKTFPSMPVKFWNDPDRSKYRAAYFETYPGVWRHGDWAEITEHDGLIIYGRSDATLNPGGVRIGTAEIYRQVEQLPEIIESVAIGQEIDSSATGDVRIVLFVRLRDGLTLDDALRTRIRKQIRDNTSPLHVPKKIVQVADIPRTVSGKISELAVRETVHSRPVKNTEALANPESLKLYREIPELSQ